MIKKHTPEKGCVFTLAFSLMLRHNEDSRVGYMKKALTQASLFSIMVFGMSLGVSVFYSTISMAVGQPKNYQVVETANNGLEFRYQNCNISSQPGAAALGEQCTDEVVDISANGGNLDVANVRLGYGNADQICTYNVSFSRNGDSVRMDVLNRTSGNAIGGNGCDNEGPGDQSFSVLTEEEAANGNGAADGDETAAEETKCQIDGIGWIICPVSLFIAGALDGVYAVIGSMLEVTPLNTDTSDQDSPTYSLYVIWQSARNIANILFVIAILLVIMSHLTSIGITNYTIKKMLPRIIASAILVNLSYWICAILVDVSNIVGWGLQGFLEANRPDLINTSQSDSAEMWTTVVTAVLFGASSLTILGVGYSLLAVAPGVIVAAFSAITPLMLAALLAVLVAFLIIAARHALVIILIAVAPIAFCAFLLPNTEKYFTFWRKAFVACLMLFPIFSLIFGLSQIAGFIIISSAPLPLTDEASTGQEVLGLIMVGLGLAVLVAPLVFIPKIVAIGGGVVGKLAGMANNKNRGLIDRAKKRRADEWGTRAQMWANKPNSKRSWMNPGAAAGRSLYQRGARNKQTREVMRQAAKNQGTESWAEEVQTAKNVVAEAAAARAAGLEPDKVPTRRQEWLASQSALTRRAAGIAAGQEDSDIKDRSTQLTMEYAGSLSQAEQGLRDALAQEVPDAIDIQAHVSMLSNSFGVRGVEVLNEVVASTVAGSGSETERIVTMGIRSNVGSVRPKDKALSDYANGVTSNAPTSVRVNGTDRQVIANTDMSAGGLEPEKLVGLSTIAMAAEAQHGRINASTAEFILETPELSQKILNSPREAILRNIVASGGGASSSTTAAAGGGSTAPVGASSASTSSSASSVGSSTPRSAPVSVTTSSPPSTAAPELVIPHGVSSPRPEAPRIVPSSSDARSYNPDTRTAVQPEIATQARAALYNEAPRQGYAAGAVPTPQRYTVGEDLSRPQTITNIINTVKPAGLSDGDLARIADATRNSNTTEQKNIYHKVEGERAAREHLRNRFEANASQSTNSPQEPPRNYRPR